MISKCTYIYIEYRWVSPCGRDHHVVQNVKIMLYRTPTCSVIFNVYSVGTNELSCLLSEGAPMGSDLYLHVSEAVGQH